MSAVKPDKVMPPKSRPANRTQPSQEEFFPGDYTHAPAGDGDAMLYTRAPAGDGEDGIRQNTPAMGESLGSNRQAPVSDAPPRGPVDLSPMVSSRPSAQLAPSSAPPQHPAAR